MFSWPDGGSVADGRRQAGSGGARNRARARLNWASQGHRWGRCKVRRRAELVSRPAIEKKRRRRVLVVTSCSPRPMRAVQRARLCARMAGQRAGRRRQAGNGRARNRARAPLNWFSQGQRWGRCKVRRRAERVSRPAIEKNRCRRVLVVTTGSPRPMRAVQRARLCAITWTASQAALAAKRPERGDGSVQRRT